MRIAVLVAFTFNVLAVDGLSCPHLKGWLTCESFNNADKTCSHPYQTSAVEFVEQLSYSQGTCIRDSTYGITSANSVWVKSGCSAKFEICFELILATTAPPTTTTPVPPAACPDMRGWATCQGLGTAYKACNLSPGDYTVTSTVFKHDFSDGKCIKDSGYGITSAGNVWVNNGCIAEFEICFEPVSTTPSINDIDLLIKGTICPGYHAWNSCENENGRYKECEFSQGPGLVNTGIAFLRDLSDGKCVNGITYGIKSLYKVWTQSGCIPQFDVCFNFDFAVPTTTPAPPTTQSSETTTHHHWCYEDYPILDGLLCYKLCDSGYSHEGGGPICWANCPARTINAGAVCIKDSYGRGVGNPLSTCDSSSDKNGLLCYPKCKTGYYGVGPVCWQRCRSGYTDDGALCRRNAHIYGRDTSDCPWHDKCGLCGGPWTNVCGQRRNCGGSCGSGYHNDGCTCRRDVHIYAKDSYGRGVGSSMNCAPDEEQSGALCYRACDAGYKGVGPVCWTTCGGQTIDTGAQCQKKSYGRGVGKPLSCLKIPQLSDITNYTGLTEIFEQTSGFENLQAAGCAAVYHRVKFWITLIQTFSSCSKKGDWQTLSISFTAGVAAGYEVGGEIGVAVDSHNSKGICYIGYCFGMKTDISIGAELNIGWWKSLDSIPGVSYASEIGLDIPFTEIGFSVVFIVNTDDEYIGTQFAFGIGVGLMPVEVGFGRCDTPEDLTIPFTM